MAKLDRSEHLSQIRPLALRVRRANALGRRLGKLMEHNWNWYVSRDGRKVWITDRVTCLNRIKKALGLRNRVGAWHLNINDNNRAWGQLNFRVR
jgi:hypothetical protein